MLCWWTHMRCLSFLNLLCLLVLFLCSVFCALAVNIDARAIRNSKDLRATNNVAEHRDFTSADSNILIDVREELNDVADDASSSRAGSQSIVTASGSSFFTVAPSGLPATIVTEPPTSLPSASLTASSGYTSISQSTPATGTASGTEEVVTITATPTAAQSITVVMVSVKTVISTVTAPGSTIAYTTTMEETMFSTIEQVTTQSSTGSIPSGFLPVDAAPHQFILYSSLLPFTVCFMSVLVMIL